MTHPFSVLSLCGLSLCLLSARPAGADDRCLEGASYVEDQRELAAVRDAVESACPCATTPDVPSYRRCARDVVTASVLSGDLRSRCRRIANRDFKRATCGSTKIACGRFKPGSRRAPHTCRIKPASRCADRPAFDESVCATQTHCRDVVDWTASTCIDPREPGALAAGVRVLTYSKPSQVTPANTRQIETAIWYPTTASGSLDPTYEAILDAPVDTSTGPHPLVIFSHGLCGLPQQSTFLTSYLATHGYIVVAPTHFGSSANNLPGCLSPTTIVLEAIERPHDAIHVTDELIAADLNGSSPFFGAVDEERIGISGHSFGGSTTFQAVGMDARYDVAVLLAPAVPASMPVLGIPSLTMIGDLDSVMVGGFGSDNDDRRAAFEAAQPPKVWANLLHTGHYAFSDGCLGGPDCAAGTLDQDEAHALVRRFVRPFLGRHLDADPTFDPFFITPAPPGVELERVD